MTEDYEDIIRLPHHVSRRHPRMSAMARAAQFAPFAALTGHEAALVETRRLTEGRIELSEEETERLDARLQQLRAVLEEEPRVTVEYFRPDDKKEGGACLTYSGHLRRIDEQRRLLIFAEGTQIPIPELLDIERIDNAQIDTAQIDTAQIGTAQIGTVQIDTARFDTVRSDIEEMDAARSNIEGMNIERTDLGRDFTEN